MALIAELRCESCGHESNAVVERLFPLSRHPCSECAGPKRVVALIRDRRTRDIAVEHDRRVADDRVVAERSPRRLHERA